MTAPKRRLALTKRVSLANLSEGWDECYAIIRPATYQEYQEFLALDVADMTPADQMKVEIEMVTEHFVSGKILILDAEGESQLEDMKPEDIRASLPLANTLFFEILGVKLDPKGSVTAA
jgi:hypothetical protein